MSVLVSRDVDGRQSKIQVVVMQPRTERCRVGRGAAHVSKSWSKSFLKALLKIISSACINNRQQMSS